MGGEKNIGAIERPLARQGQGAAAAAGGGAGGRGGGG